MEYSENKKIVVFEGISGAGKSTIINALRERNIFPQCSVYNWFSKESFRYIASNIHLYADNLSPSTYSIIYALEYLAKMDEIRSDQAEIILLHRYIYTPFAHEMIRGIDEELIHFLYNNPYYIPPLMTIFIDIEPEKAYYRIRKKRRPSYFECGLDILFKNKFEDGKKYYSSLTCEEEKRLFIDFQSKVNSNYNKILPTDAVRIDSELCVDKQVEVIKNYF